MSPLQRVAGLGLLLVVEVLAISIWLDTRSLADAQGLTALIADRGAAVLRFVVGFTLVLLTFGQSSLRPLLTQPSGRGLDRGIAWPLLGAHFGLAVLFVGLTSILFAARLPPAVDNAVAAAWVGTGVAAVALAALAFSRLAQWTQWVSSLRPVLLFVSVVSLTALVFGWLALTFWQPMSRLTLLVATALLRPFASEVTADPATLIMGAPEFRVHITQACSGYEGLGLVFVFTAAWLWFYRADWRFPHALIVLPLGLAAAWLFNCVRIAALVYIGLSGAPDIAEGGFHSQAGWLGFNAIALAVCLATRRVPWLAATRSNTQVRETSNPTAAYLIPFLVLLASAMVSQLASADFEWLHPIRVIATGAALCYFIGSYRVLDWRIGWPSVGLGIAAFAIWIGLEHVTGGARAAMPLALSEAPEYRKMIWLAIRVLGVVVTVPLAEELAFRGFLLRRFDSVDFEAVNRHSVTWLAVLFSSLAFGVLHGERWLAGTIAGGVYASAFLRRGAIGDAVAAHATTNLLLAAWILSTGDWQLW